MVIIGVMGLIGVRVVEDRLFYDPFLNYFRSVHMHKDMPSFDLFPLIVSHLGRFLINLLFSALIVQGFFKNMVWTKQAIVLMTVVFVIVLPVYIYCVETNFSVGELFSFYVRRFLIQPLILIVLIPMFYYRKSIEGRN